jgi:hypothetical protein
LYLSILNWRVAASERSFINPSELEPILHHGTQHQATKIYAFDCCLVYCPADTVDCGSNLVEKSKQCRHRVRNINNIDKVAKFGV